MNLEKSLEDEIAFWQTLIKHQANDTPSEVLERMVQARQLAEQRLLSLHVEGRKPCVKRRFS